MVQEPLERLEPWVCPSSIEVIKPARSSKIGRAVGSRSNDGRAQVSKLEVLVHSFDIDGRK